MKWVRGLTDNMTSLESSEDLSLFVEDTQISEWRHTDVGLHFSLIKMTVALSELQTLLEGLGRSLSG